MRDISLGQLTDIERLIKSWSILIKTMPIFKTSFLCYDVVLGIIDNLNKELVNGIAVDFNVFGYVVV